MFRKLALLALFVTPAFAQQAVFCPTRPPGDSSNACASTAFVSGGGVTASNVVFTPGGGVTSTNVQAAILELDTKKAAISSLASIAFSGSIADIVGQGTQISVSTVVGNSTAAGTLSLKGTSNGSPSGDSVGIFANGGQRLTVKGTNVGLLNETNPQNSAAGMNVSISANASTGINNLSSLFNLVSADTSFSSMSLDSYTGGTPAFGGLSLFRTARGSFASPTNVAANDTLGLFGARPFIGGAFSAANTGRIVFNYTDNGTNSGTSITAESTPNGGTRGVTGVWGGVVPTMTGTCAANTQTGGTAAGTFSANGACAGGTYIMTFAYTSSVGWACDASDRTTTTNTVRQTASTTTTATFLATTANADVISFKCQGY